MFENLTQRLAGTLKNLRGQARLTEANIQESMREVRMALLEADVALPVVKTFIERVSSKAIGQDVLGSLTPGQALIKVVNDELTAVMGQVNERLNLSTTPPAVVLLAGLQGSGKTTSAAKLARLLQEREKKSVMVVSCDVYRPAAIQQLETLAGQVGAAFFPSTENDKPVAIVKAALDQARKQFADVLIVDTAGRLHVDDAMMAEVQALHAAIEPVETLFVIDSMTGQDAVNSAQAFNDALPLTGVILTKTDGDARGGAALSVREVTGKPIKFIGVGEKTDALEPFHPDRIASRILGMGDVMGLIEEAHRKVDQDKSKKLAKKITKGKGFDLTDFRDQLREMNKMGGMAGLMDKLPGMSQVPQAVKSQVNDGEMNRLAAIIDSMTPQERQFPAIIKGSRKRRIAAGSGTRVQDVNRMLKQFMQMQKMMKRMAKKGGMAKLMRGMKGGGMPGMPF